MHTLEKMFHTWKSAAHIKQVPYFEGDSPGEMGHTKECGILGKLCNTWNSVAH